MMNPPPLPLRLSNLTIAVSLLVVMQAECAASTMPEGMKGWWYFTGINSPDHYAPDPLTACRLTAENHMRTPLLAMRPTPGSLGNIMDCKYQTMLGVPKEGD